MNCIHDTLSALRRIPRRLTHRLLFGLALLAPPALGAEVDRFSRHPPLLPDAAEVLNAEVNRRLDLAIDLVNSQTRRARAARCDNEALLRAIEDLVGGLVFGEIERFANALPQYFRHDTPLDQSIYRDLSLIEAPTLVTYGALAPSIRIDGVRLGTDKLGHFFSDGFQYFERYHLERKSISETLLAGEITELSLFGSMVTGIYSYADLVANFQGMRFWNRLLGEQPDILSGRFPSAYISCEAGRFHRTHDFDWRDYVDPAWNETINCNRYATPAILAKIQRRQHDAGAGGACQREHRWMPVLRDY
ncbi:MAG: hypothetical protein ACFCUJ_02615, partial [Thiotrichales bacterium]